MNKLSYNEFTNALEEFSKDYEDLTRRRALTVYTNEEGMKLFDKAIKEEIIRSTNPGEYSRMKLREALIAFDL